MDKSRTIGELVIVALKAVSMVWIGVYQVLTLSVTPQRHLPNREIIGKQDPFCVFTIGEYKGRTKTDYRGGQHPMWDDQVNIPVPTGTRKMFVQLFDEDKKKDDLICDTEIDLTKVLSEGEYDEWFKLYYKGREAGEVFLELTFYSSAPPPKRTATRHGQMATRPAQAAPPMPQQIPAYPNAYPGHPANAQTHVQAVSPAPQHPPMTAHANGPPPRTSSTQPARPPQSQPLQGQRISPSPSMVPPQAQRVSPGAVPAQRVSPVPANTPSPQQTAYPGPQAQAPYPPVQQQTPYPPAQPQMYPPYPTTRPSPQPTPQLYPPTRPQTSPQPSVQQNPYPANPTQTGPAQPQPVQHVSQMYPPVTAPQQPPPISQPYPPQPQPQSYSNASQLIQNAHKPLPHRNSASPTPPGAYPASPSPVGAYPSGQPVNENHATVHSIYPPDADPYRPETYTLPSSPYVPKMTNQQVTFPQPEPGWRVPPPSGQGWSYQ